ncbi:MAG: hypothetical protein ACTJG1_09005, partial [Enterococcus gilvus]
SVLSLTLQFHRKFNVVTFVFFISLVILKVVSENAVKITNIIKRKFVFLGDRKSRSFPARKIMVEHPFIEKRKYLAYLATIIVTYWQN